MPDVTIRPQTSQDDAAVVAINNRLYSDLPPITLDTYRHRVATIPEGNPVVRCVAEQDGAVVGSVDLIRAWFIRRPNVYFGSIEVDPSQQGRGIGSRLYQRLLQEAEARGATRLYGRPRESFPQALHFLTERGFTPSGHAHRISRLEVARVNLEGYEGIEERLRQEGIRLATLAEIGAEDEEFLRALHRLGEESGRDAPHAEESESTPFEVWREGRLRGPGKSPDWIWVALDGRRPVGVAQVRHDTPKTAGNSYTGVDRAYRGRGIARALKLRTIAWARRNDVEFIYTGNDLQNQRMLDINIRLGYQPLPAFVEMVKDLEASGP